MRTGYARVSTEEQNLALQLQALQKAGCEKIYQEKISSVQQHRPALEQMMNQFRQGDTLVVWKLDRLGRSLKELISLINQLAQKGVALSSLHERIDTSSPAGKLTFHLFCALAEFERELIRERTLAGLKAARARKRLLGRPRGLSKGAQKKAYTARALYREGTLTTREISAQLGISLPTLYRYLKQQNTTLRAAKNHF